ncbi:hypothetical protein [Anabaenopsis elenkinii]|uniref:Uncharacterized protein n=1 Tax=Anabaenopsis elenkinii CCIBt3563 TaxID=2779889 RepID=A0A7S6RKI0_9CYAN|nr:hypothetical protein [Anabaenopsis elenkinii]QOV24812.1 hypothetical protein IM676_03580 [Anabaenopsis elenkinii CCIBt3563]
MLETLRDRVGTPELVPKNVICTASFRFPLTKLFTLYLDTVFAKNTKACIAGITPPGGKPKVSQHFHSQQRWL